MKQTMTKQIRLIAMAMIVVILATVMPWEPQTAIVKAATEGTAIRTESELRKMSMNGEYYLANDIVLTEDWKTLGTFTGVLDGNGYTIKNLNITEPQDDGEGVKLYGMFKEVSSAGTVRNLGIEGTIKVPETVEGIGISAGLLAAIISNDYYTQEGEIRVSNCYVKGSVSSASSLKQQQLGGLAGTYMAGVANNCYSAVNGAPIYGIYTMANIKNFYTDTTLYSGELESHTTGKTTAEMKSEEFLSLLNKNAVGVTWVSGADGYPVLANAGDSAEDEEEVEITYISTEEELRNVATNLSGHYVLKNDITLTSDWTMIGSVTTPFSGIFDGNGYVIRDVIYSGIEKEIGMFAVSTGTIKNLGVTGAIGCTKYSNYELGGIVGVNKGEILNCYADIALSATYATRYGIIAGDSRTGDIRNCYAVGSIKRSGTIYPLAVPLENLTGTNYYDSTVFSKTYTKPGIVGKSTEEMQSEAFVALLNANREDNRTWYYNEGGYPVLRKPKVEVNVDTVTLLANIASQYEATKDSFEIIDMVGYGKLSSLTNTDAFVKEAAELVTTKESANFSTDLEKTIIALSALGYDASYFSYEGMTYDAIKELGQIDMEDALVNSLIFAINAYDSGNYEADKAALQTKEEIITLLLETQKKDGGFAFMGRTGDVDMTAMAIHALARYYVAETAAEAGISQLVFEQVKTAVDQAIIMLSEAQNEEGMFANSGSANSNSSSMVIVALSALGIDAGSDERFVKDETSAVEALLTFATEDLNGFKWKATDVKANAMATEQAFRAMVAYNHVKEGGKAFNIYSYGTIRAERPVETPVVPPVTTPTEQPTETPEVTPTEKPVATPTPTVKPTEKPVATPTPTVKPVGKTVVKAESQTKTTVTISWKSIKNVSGYEVQQYKGGKWITVKTLKASKVSYKVKELKAGTTYKFRVRGFVTVGGKKVYGENSKTLTTATKTKTPVIKKMTTSSKKVTITWNKVSGADGYVIYKYNTSTKKYEKVKTIKKGSTVTYSQSKLKKGATAKYKVRAYKVAGSKTVYSDLSAAKSIKVK